MGDDASLDEFIGDGASREPSAETGPNGDEPASETDSDGEQSGESVEPATTTYEFAPDGAECDSCGASVDRRWHQDGTLVCAACKDW